MAKRKKKRHQQLELVTEPLKIGDRVDCPLGQNLPVYWISPAHGMVWVCDTPTRSRPVWLHECRRVEPGDDATAQ